MPTNILPKALFAAAALGVFTASPATAQACPDGPAFVAERTANDDVSAAATRIERGDWRTAAHFAREALDGASARNAGAANVNLCAALANRADDEALEVCNAAVELSEQPWRAHTNRGAALWLAGDYGAARADFARAAELAPNEDAVIENRALSGCGG